MGFRKSAMAATVAMAMAVVPTLAQAASPASRLSIGTPAAARAGAVRQDESKAGGTVILAVLAVAAVAAGIIVAVDGGNDNDGPVSR